VVHPISFDLHPVLQRQAKFGKELDRSVKVLNDDPDVVHSQKLGRRLPFSLDLINHYSSQQILAGQPIEIQFDEIPGAIIPMSLSEVEAFTQACFFSSPKAG
jgi:hypothetical protein